MKTEKCCPSSGSECCTPAVDPAGGSFQDVPRVAARLTLREKLADWGVRLGFGRFNYRVQPGLYALGNPGPLSEVLVSSNYKLSFNHLRRSMAGHDAWIMVIDTRGINVWCAAGKGSFSDGEISRVIELIGLKEVVNHRRLILPQLAAPGVAAHRLKAESGFSVHYGPVRAEDLPCFLAAGLQADPGMRRVNFNLKDRLAVAAMELIRVLKYFFYFLLSSVILMLVLGKLDGYGVLRVALPVLGALLAGSVLFPALLPVLPFRAFTLKGWLLGLPWALVMVIWIQPGIWGWIAALAVLPVLTALVALNYTGSTTFTSQSGVNREIRLFIRPLGYVFILGILAYFLELLV